MKRCALVEDDTIFLAIMHKYFEGKSWLCDDYEDTNSALSGIKHTVYDLFIIDVNLPGDNGITLLHDIRSKYPQVPIIMVSGNDDIETIMNAYDSGCDDYMKKPFDLRELEIKVLKLMNEVPLNLSDSVQYSMNDRILYVNNEEVHLSQKESNLLHTFMTNINRPLTHDYLESVIWGSVDDNGHALRNLILRMRKRIGKGIIDTVQGKGYILRLNASA